MLSALELAQEEVLDIPNLLDNHQMKDMPYYLIPGRALFLTMLSEIRRAKNESRIAFCYMRLTSDECLPPWISADMVGGKSLLPGEHGAGLGMSEVAKLDAAIRLATSKPRWLKTLPQWHACWAKFCVAAVATGLHSHALLYVYSSLIDKLAEKCRAESMPIGLVLLYDEMRRISIAARANSGDLDLKLMSEMSTLD